jgi:serine protease
VDSAVGNAVAVERATDSARPLPLAANVLESLPGVVSAQPDKLMYLIDPAPGEQDKPVAPAQSPICVNPLIDLLQFPINGTSEYLPYGIQQIQATESVFKTDKTRKNVIFCVLDTGVWAAHPDLSGGNNLLAGCSPPRCPWAWNEDEAGHGTHVTGTIAARRDGDGVVGVASNGAHVYTVNLFGSNAFFQETELITAWSACISYLDGIKSTTNPSAKMIISMSLGGPGPATPAVQAEINAMQARGDVLFVAASGNAGDEQTSYPAGYKNVVSVGATTAIGSLAEFTQFDADLDLLAPGDLVLSTSDPMGASSLSPFASSLLRLDPDSFGSQLSKPLPTMFAGAARRLVSGRVVDCGLGETVCENASGAICVISRAPRGSVDDPKNYFCNKVNNCMKGGGIGALVYNSAVNECETVSGGTLVSSVCDLNVDYVPTLGLSRLQGGAILNSLQGGAQLTATLRLDQTLPPFAYLSGTSMSTPHVTGAAGLIWGAYPNCSNADVLAALRQSTKQIPNFSVNGAGLVQVKAAYEYLRKTTCGQASIASDASPPPPQPPLAPTVCARLRGQYRIQSVACPSRFLSYNFACRNRRAALQTRLQAPGLGTVWTLDAAVGAFGGVKASSRNCTANALASARGLTLGSTSNVWQYRFISSRGSCNVYSMSPRSAFGRGLYLGVTNDCTRLLWRRGATTNTSLWRVDPVNNNRRRRSGL